MCYEFHAYEFPFMELCFYGIRLLMNFLFMELCFMEICLRMIKQVFITIFKVSYQPSDLREVMFRPKGTHDGKYETMGDIRRSFPRIPLCLRALVRHRAHMNKFDKFFQKWFLRNIFMNVCYVILSFLWMCIFYTNTLVLAERKLTLYVRVTGDKDKQPVNPQ